MHFMTDDRIIPASELIINEDGSVFTFTSLRNNSETISFLSEIPAEWIWWRHILIR